MLGPDAEFREGQREAIEAVIGDGSRALVVQRTGWGKSLVYWIATRVRRDDGPRPDADRQPAARADAQPDRDGGAARAAGGDDQLRQRRRVARDRGTPRPRRDRRPPDLPGAARERGLREPGPAGDPAARSACSSSTRPTASRDWGHDFRPDYRRIGRLLPLLGPDVPVLATTATANDRVVEDVAAQLGEDVAVIRGPLARDTLRLDAIPLRTRRSGSPGWPSTSRGCRAAGSSTASRSPTRSGSRRWLQTPRHRRPRLHRPDGPRAPARRSRTPCSRTS